MEKKKQGIFEEYYEYIQRIALQKIRKSRKGKEQEIPELAEELWEVAELLAGDREYDVSGGNAGAVFAFVNAADW